MPDTPVRVLHVVSSLGLGGTEKAMQLLVAHLDRSRFEPTVYSPVDGERGVQLRAMRISTHVSDDLLTVLMKVRPDIVHIHRAGWPEPHALRSIRLANVPAVVETSVFGRPDPSPQAGVIDHTLFVSRFCLDRFAQTTGIDPDPARYSVLYNPVDTDFFASATPDERDFSIPSAGRISRADPGKWSCLALDFLPAVVRAIPDFRYHVIGSIPAAAAFVREHGLDRHVAFHEPVTTDREIATFMNSISLLAHANDAGESFGLVIAEAMACGLPVVTHPCSGLKDNAQLELVEHGVTGLVAATRQEYAKAVIFLLTNPDAARRMGQAGREKAATLYRAQTIAAKLETLYQELTIRKGIHR
ncbi:MAG: glycosyltransferase family 4 protein [Pseudodesulfovibrio sp.]|uniref:Glycosyl transferase group 1 n=1 Tax=Pseudodesulfovibrio aespoeensis (strain ATCC 700646 / DSM 10631 / Aspo-2) TaxID=643562 RepID=E6VSW1_PSEA9|nr:MULTISPECIES: glycosyltransferase family 4 protein [Pseudodesulfovibrio]MBU4192488.1 glycosyltransferase family 4 protein [Pseudomonadota bacterium]ADU63205.1 glycosyl transferase group 1 [Pseudodesulfovibrio aespoeensis Aspo-2]MBU4243269.1 glycosyltransferase family 4 protein [Pseudomonadota bacterium]MBU4379154.1 glycosyltransferase family 4 protein [Pseudomonadota bacterium]MBU4475102.1 glycosyltransferase family 4 protein [Pseudomonadota bacterium]